MNKIDPVFIKAITDNVTEVKETAENVPDWKYAENKFNQDFEEIITEEMPSLYKKSSFSAALIF